MSNIYFTSDTHFTQQRTLELTRRPFNSVDEMDQCIIDKWNKIVNDDDIIYHLGDFGNFKIADKLNGKIILILGNYEIEEMYDKAMSFYNYRTYLKMNYNIHEVYEKNFKYLNDKEIWNLTHKPIDCDRTKFNLFGHIHRSQMIKPYGLNIGIDCNYYKLFSLHDVLFYKNALENRFYDENVFDKDMRNKYHNP